MLNWSYLSFLRVYFKLVSLCLFIFIWSMRLYFMNSRTDCLVLYLVTWFPKQQAEKGELGWIWSMWAWTYFLTNKQKILKICLTTQSRKEEKPQKIQTQSCLHRYRLCTNSRYCTVLRSTGSSVSKNIRVWTLALILHGRMNKGKTLVPCAIASVSQKQEHLLSVILKRANSLFRLHT